MPPRPPKKSETLEIRLPHAAKTAFMARCRAEGLTASEAVRRFIEGRTAAPDRSFRVKAAAALMAGLAIGAVAAPSIARSATDDHAAFARLDRNGDGVISLDEYRAR